MNVFVVSWNTLTANMVLTLLLAQWEDWCIDRAPNCSPVRSINDSRKQYLDDVYFFSYLIRMFEWI